MVAKVISFGSIKIYRSMCKCCGSILEYDACHAGYDIFEDNYTSVCPACNTRNYFAADERVEYGIVKLTRVLPRYA